MRKYLFYSSVIYILLSLLGVFWISDEFDFIRYHFFGYIIIPFTIFYYGSIYFYSNWWVRNPNFFRIAVSVLLLSYLWGHLLLLNAVGGNTYKIKSDVALDDLMQYQYYQGGFGWNYRKRW